MDAIATKTHLCILLQYILTKGTISPFLTTMWYHTDGIPKQYCCAPDIYLLSCIYLGFYSIIDR